jgi:signal transduction histidine kinase
MTDQSHRGVPIRIETDADSVARDLLRLVLTLVELIRQLMERQAIRRLDELDDDQAEALGAGLMRLQEAIDELREAHGIRPEDLDIDLGPFGTLLAT